MRFGRDRIERAHRHQRRRCHHLHGRQLARTKACGLADAVLPVRGEEGLPLAGFAQCILKYALLVQDIVVTFGCPVDGTVEPAVERLVEKRPPTAPAASHVHRGKSHPEPAPPQG